MKKCRKCKRNVQRRKKNKEKQKDNIFMNKEG